MPSDPASAAARSDNMSAWRFDATIVSRLAGRIVMRMVIASTSILSQVVREFARDLRADLVPHHHGVPLRVGFRDDREQLARPRPRERKSEAEDAFDAGPGHDRNIGCDFVRQASMHAAADAGIF